MRHAMRAIRLNLKHLMEDYPAEAVVVGGILATGMVFIFALAIEEGCVPDRAAAACPPATVAVPAGVDLTVGGCGVWSGSSQATEMKRGTVHGSSVQSGQPPASLAVAPAGSMAPPYLAAESPSAAVDGPGGHLFRRMRVTAYCPCERCCGRFADGITASLSRADHPLVAAPRDMAFGTRLRVPNYAVGWEVKVEDRGGAIKGDRLDVLFPEHESARQWGVQWLDVEIGIP